VVPACARKRTRLETPQRSSSSATRLSAVSTSPVYTASSVSNSLPHVSITALPVSGAVQLYQTECPPESGPWTGSPASRVAPSDVPVVVPIAPVSVIAAAKASFGGGRRRDQRSVNG